MKSRRGDGEDGMRTSNTSWVALMLAKVIFPSPGAAPGCRVAPAALAFAAGSGEEEGGSPPQAASCRCFPVREEQRGRSLKGKGKTLVGLGQKLLPKETALRGYLQQCRVKALFLAWEYFLPLKYVV